MSDSAPRAPRRGSFEVSLDQLPLRIGEILVERALSGEFLLRHRDDAQRKGLPAQISAECAAEIARYDDNGLYRPLKTAPNLRHGWMLQLLDERAVRLALDLFYPGRIAAYEASAAGDLKTTAFRETLARQSGMYRVAAEISDQQADELIGHFCRSDGGCLRTILWRRNLSGAVPSTLLPPEKYDPRHDQTERGEVMVPLLCQEICNLLVAAAREVVKTQ